MEMIDREKIIEGVQKCAALHQGFACEGCEYPGGDCAIDDALALLKAQEAVEPVVDIDTWKCGNCGHTLEHQELLGDNVLFHEQYNFCPECGRTVKWE